MTGLQILVYDDVAEIADDFATKIRNSYRPSEVHVVGPAEFESMLELINSRRRAWRNDSSADAGAESHRIDQADLVVVDYDLLGYAEDADITGNRFAYLLRCYTKCGLILVLNEYGANTFDLGLCNLSLSYADLNLGADQIANPGLWTDQRRGYRPWYWPIVPQARANFEKCVDDVLEHFEHSALEFLGLSRFMDRIPKRARDYFMGIDNTTQASFGDLVRSARSGKEASDALPREFGARVVAARLLRFLNGLLLPEQSVLVNAPHLVSRYPSLLQGNPDDVDDWNCLCDSSAEVVEEYLPLDLNDHRFEFAHWLWRPGWFWPSVEGDGRIAEVADPWSIRQSEFVFCENVSCFAPSEIATSFIADVSPPFSQRYVLKDRSVEAERFVNWSASGGPQDPWAVKYVPQVAFSL